MSGVKLKTRGLEPLSRRTGSRVRRDSVSERAGERVRRRLDRNEATRIMLAARVYERVKREPGKAWSVLPPSALKLLELMTNLAVKKAGVLELSAGLLAVMLRCKVATVHRAKAALRAHGFLGWVRRFGATGREGMRGPQVEQLPNAYWVARPACAPVPKFSGAAKPDDAELRRRMIAKLHALEVDEQEGRPAKLELMRALATAKRRLIARGAHLAARPNEESPVRP